MGSQPPPGGEENISADGESARLAVGSGDSAREIAVLSRRGRAPGVFWLGGFGSNMRGAKATALDAFARDAGLASVRFDYSGHGESSGRFEDGTVTRWLEDARAVFDRLALQPQIVVGSSMGGWIALLLAAALRDSGRIAGLVLIAPAVDMTEDLIWQQMDRKARAALASAGSLPIPGSGLPITRALIEDGRQHLFGDRLIAVGCPVAILQGVRDAEVPFQHAEKLISRLASDDVVLTLVKDGDHRLSRPEDLALMTGAVARMVADFDAAARVSEAPQ
jgi:pimeloyl-ACP methyl ester carboxylesterase